MHFGVQILAAVPQNYLKSRESVQRGAMWNASGCIHSTSTETLEMLA